MSKIKEIRTLEILNSKSNPAIEVTVVLDDNSIGTASCPSGTSVGTYEAMELHDKDENRFSGLGVLKAIENIKTIVTPKLSGMDANDQQTIDKTLIELDQTQNKSRLGTNTTLSVSMAICKAAAKSSNIPLFLYIRQFIHKEGTILKIPTPIFNLINGGQHAEENVDFQEFHIIPASSTEFSAALRLGAEVYRSLFHILKKNGYSTLVGDEGGFAPTCPNNIDPFYLLTKAIENTKYRFSFDVFFGLDAASNNFYSEQKYHLKDKSTGYSAQELIQYYKEINNTYHLLYLEDGLSEDNWDDWTMLTSQLSTNIMIAGDDLTATNPYRLQMALNKKAITAVIIKPNQIGTVLETLAVVEMAKQAGLKIIVSHRSGETNDDFIADFAVAVSSDYIKFGAPARGERVAKYNRLLHIEKQLEKLNVIK